MKYLRERNKRLKTFNQLTQEEKNIIDKEFKRIYELMKIIKKDEYNQLKGNDFEVMIEGANKHLDLISKTEEGFYAKYIILTEEFMAVKTKGKSIVRFKI